MSNIKHEKLVYTLKTVFTWCVISIFILIGALSAFDHFGVLIAFHKYMVACVSAIVLLAVSLVFIYVLYNLYIRIKYIHHSGSAGYIVIATLALVSILLGIGMITTFIMLMMPAIESIF